jgi:cation transport regulator ChaC
MTPPAATAASSAPAVRPRRPAPRRPPRRVSGPLRPATAPSQTRRSAAAQPGLVLGLLAALESLSQHRLLDRLIRGRIWIGIVAFALLGIVAMQLVLLELNGGIGRALEHEATLQRENAALSIENSERASGTRVQAGAKKLGMTLTAVGALRFLSAGGHGDVARAAAALADSAKAQAQAREASAAEAEAAAASGESGEASESEVSGEGGEAAGATSSSSEESGESSESSAESSSAEAGSETEAAGSEEAESSGGATGE